MNQTLNFLDDIDYQQSVYPPLVIDKIEDSGSIKYMIDLLNRIINYMSKHFLKIILDYCF